MTGSLKVPLILFTSFADPELLTEFHLMKVGMYLVVVISYRPWPSQKTRLVGRLPAAKGMCGRKKVVQTYPNSLLGKNDEQKADPRV